MNILLLHKSTLGATPTEVVHTHVIFKTGIKKYRLSGLEGLRDSGALKD